MQLPIPASPTTEERKQWWLLCYAVTSMEKAIESCRLIKMHCADNRQPLFEPLIVALHSYYSRPFGPNHGVGRLSEDFVPSERIGIHRCLLHFRNSVLSHTDSRPSKEANRPMHDVVYSRKGDLREFSTSSPLPAIGAYYDFADHCSVMDIIFRTKILEFEKRYCHCLPMHNGDFLMTLDDSLDLFTPHTLPIQGTLHYS